MVRGRAGVGWAKRIVPTNYFREPRWWARREERLLPTLPGGGIRPQCGEDGVQAVGQRGRTGLQDQRRLDLDNAVVAHCRNLVPARPTTNTVRNHFLAAP